MSDKYDASKVRVTIGGVEVQGLASDLISHVEMSLGYTVDTLTKEYAEACAAGLISPEVPRKTLRERGWKWRR